MKFIHKYTAIVALGLLVGCDGQQEAVYEPAVPKVKTLIVSHDAGNAAALYPGRVQAIQVAEVRARVAGIVLERTFTEGTKVKAGQTLFVIDPAPYQAALDKAQAEVIRTQALLDESQASFKRYEQLVKSNAVSRHDFDRIKATFHTAKATHQAAIAELKTARLNYQYTQVTAPIKGRVGRAFVTEGALVGQNEPTSMALIQNIDSVYIDFKVPSDELFLLRQTHTTLEGLPVEAWVKAGMDPLQGELVFADISVDQDTGQVLVRGKFANPDAWLLPGMYVQARIHQTTTHALFKVPQRAVKVMADGSQRVWVLDEGKVSERLVVTGAMQGSDWLVLEGLAEGDEVVIDGQVKLGDSATAL